MAYSNSKRAEELAKNIRTVENGFSSEELEGMRSSNVAPLFIKANKSKWRFETPRGQISVEDLYDLPLIELYNVYCDNEDSLASTPRRQRAVSATSEVTVKTEKNKIIGFIIASTIYEYNERVNAVNAKLAAEAKNAEIDAIIARKKTAALENMTIEELEAMKS